MASARSEGNRRTDRENRGTTVLVKGLCDVRSHEKMMKSPMIGGKNSSSESEVDSTMSDASKGKDTGASYTRERT